mgnify:CR=1 FL=1
MEGGKDQGHYLFLQSPRNAAVDVGAGYLLSFPVAGFSSCHLQSSDKGLQVMLAQVEDGLPGCITAQHGFCTDFEPMQLACWIHLLDQRGVPVLFTICKM